MKRRYLIGLAVALTVFGAVYAVAAGLTVGSNTLQAGSDSGTSLKCETTTITTDYTVAWEIALTPDAYEVASVILGSVPDTCDDKDWAVTLTDTAGTKLAEVTKANHSLGAPPAAGNYTITFDFSTANVAADSVDKIVVAVADDDGTEAAA